MTREDKKVRDDQLRVYLDPQYTTAALRLAHRVNTSVSYLGRHAIRQLLVRAKTSVIEVPDYLIDHPGTKLVTLGLDELAQVKELADQLGTTSQKIGQLAYRELLDQAAGGAVPMIRMEMEPDLSSMELDKAGRLASSKRYNEESYELSIDLEAKINTTNAELELIRLKKLTLIETDPNPDSCS